MKIDPKHTAALVIDYQEKLVPVMYEKEALMDHTTMLLAGLHILGIPMYITQQYTQGLGMSVEDIFEASGVKREDYIDKIRFSAYEKIAPYIREKKYIIICGIESHICVLQTLMDLIQEGYVPVLVVDCISSRKERDIMVAIKRAEIEGAVLTTYESLLFELLQVAGTDTSKKIQRLIK